MADMTAKEFAETYGMSEKAARETMARYSADPGSEEFDPVRGEMQAAVPGAGAQIPLPSVPSSPAAQEVKVGGITDMVQYNGITTTLPDYEWGGPSIGGQVEATPMGAPVAAALALVGGRIALGFLRMMFRNYGPAILTFFKRWGTPIALIALIMSGLPDEHMITSKTRAKRYSIGTNPRLGTLLKVSKRCDNLLVKTDNRIRKFRARIKGPQRTGRRYYGPGQYLSPVERRQISRGR